MKRRKKRERHGATGTHLYQAWENMRMRCQNKRLPNYGGRGITFDPAWKSFLAFKAWADANGYQESLTLDRLDVNGNYSPSNCRWADVRQQARNKRNTLWIEYQGKRLCLTDWAELTGIHKNTLKARFRKGLPPDLLFAEPEEKPVAEYYEVFGEKKTLKEIASLIGLSKGGLYRRLHQVSEEIDYAD
jgi:hypothetical protein